MQADVQEIPRLDVTREQVERILQHHGKHSAPITALEQSTSTGYSTITTTKTYDVILADGTAYTLKASPPSASASTLVSESPPYAPNSLAAEHALLQLLAAQTSIPHPAALALDTTLALAPFPYLLLSRPRGIPLSLARAQGALSARQALLLDLRAGGLLRQLHAVQNDWFGLPAQAQDALFSWQEAFTGLLEGLLDAAAVRGVPLAYADVRRCLARAIGAFLFDDCEVPSLVSFAGDADAILVDVDVEAAEDAEVPVTAFLSFSHALWGDPLLETLFLDPSAALTEGYGGSPIVFARQKTKRLWYTLFLALMVVVQAARDGGGVHEDKVEWARRTLDEVVQKLKDAPCY
ncbi:hypothetical protein POSPLADRAFT_1056928 [Postia placenta MAD-698-R-SB12]|uniref:Aminoglycoside phosphotransferase domain-containing protein n=1 Tax=Postia placenta MAD-698-R-SB12 TaxID=670580 RepID=A0A1X6N148_9APHY|nr:hypothetical protein POSPLADRAFT_1056928 [Postia placenta MAD-698-R-SB12]OSX62337.1 hypothetical protein POSPLADRAFT_1056928 [Postia placenta MAD-698-R-SB12]